jgi:hypothetical protein
MIEEKSTPMRKSKRARRATGQTLGSGRHDARKYSNSKWIFGAKDPYQKYTSKTTGCKKTIQTYCSCSIGQLMCQACFVKHRIDIDNELREE